MKIRKMGVALILMMVIVITACAQSYEDGRYFEVKPINGGKAVEIVEYMGDKWNISIPPKIRDLPVTSINLTTFRNTKNLISVTIPESVNNIDRGTFLNSSLTAINVASGNKTYASQDGVLYNKDKTTLFRYPAGKTATTFIIPDSVTSIEWMAFVSCNNLTSVTIPNSVTKIGGYAFFENYSITSVTFQGTIASDKLDETVFPGDLRDKYLIGGKGTYTRPESGSKTWTKQ
jgi:hypothetical protein